MPPPVLVVLGLTRRTHSRLEATHTQKVSLYDRPLSSTVPPHTSDVGILHWKPPSSSQRHGTRIAGTCTLRSFPHCCFAHSHLAVTSRSVSTLNYFGLSFTYLSARRRPSEPTSAIHRSTHVFLDRWTRARGVSTTRTFSECRRHRRFRRPDRGIKFRRAGGISTLNLAIPTERGLFAGGCRAERVRWSCADHRRNMIARIRESTFPKRTRRSILRYQFILILGHSWTVQTKAAAATAAATVQNAAGHRRIIRTTPRWRKAAAALTWGQSTIALSVRRRIMTQLGGTFTTAMMIGQFSLLRELYPCHH